MHELTCPCCGVVFDYFDLCVENSRDDDDLGLVRCPVCDRRLGIAMDDHHLKKCFNPNAGDTLVDGVLLWGKPRRGFQRVPVEVFPDRSVWQVYITRDGNDVRVFKSDRLRWVELPPKHYRSKHHVTVNLCFFKDGRSDDKPTPVCWLQFAVKYGRVPDDNKVVEHKNDESADNEIDNIVEGTGSTNSIAAWRNRGTTPSTAKRARVSIPVELKIEAINTFNLRRGQFDKWVEDLVANTLSKR